MPNGHKLRFGKMLARTGITFAMAVAAASPSLATRFAVKHLASDGSVAAPTVDADLINPWGIAASPTGPFWVANNGSGTSTLYNTNGSKLGLTVAIPAPGNPTGIVFNGSAGQFKVTDGTKTGSSAFIFATEGGTIDGWTPSVSTAQAFQGFDGSSLGLGAVYKGLAIGLSGGSPFLYATDFRNGMIDQLDGNFNLVRAFTEPSVKPGYAPFGAQVLNNQLFVTYALQDGDKEDDVAGAGNGYVDIFNLDGSFVRQLVGQGGEINSPWGLAIAPSNFGSFAGDLLVGNFGDGTISGFDLTTGMFDGRLLGADGNPLVLGDLWALVGGNGGAGGDKDKIYFTAGVADEAHGLFGSIAPIPEPGTWGLMLLGFPAIGMALRRSRAARRLGTA